MSEVPTKSDKDKTRYDLVPGVSLRDVAEAFSYGSKKYSDYNWCKGKGLSYSRLFSATQRHLQAWYSGEDFDCESGLSHLAHAVCNLMMLQHYEYHNTDADDRRGPAIPTLRKLNER